MLVLGVDTSTGVGGLGLFDSKKGLIAENNLVLDKTHSERLMPTLELLLKSTDLKIDDIDGFAVAVGPGSFTGTRIGVTTVKTLAQLTKKPVVGVSTLKATAYNLAHIPDLICPIFDAKNRRVYTAEFRGSLTGLERLSEDRGCVIDELIEQLKTKEIRIYFVGDAVLKYESLLKEKLGEQVVIPSPIFWLPRGGSIARLGYERLVQNQADDLFTLTPNYLKPSQAEINWENKYGK